MTTSLTGIPAHVWSTEEKRILVAAARQAPKRWIDDPWTLSVHEDSLDLYERLANKHWLRDRGGRARLILCGAVLANLECAIRVLGWAPLTDLTSDVFALDRVARLKSRCRVRPVAADFARFAALSGRETRTAPSSPASWGREVAEANEGEGIRVRVLMPPHVRDLPKVGGKIARKAAPDDSWVAFLVVTATETRRQLVRAGVVAQRLLLASTEHGLVGTAFTEPFDAPAVRGTLAGIDGVPGFPQAVVVVEEPRKTPAQKGRTS
ncbi:hypothetical protein [Amycolatopsis decaplanina]|uniref:Uncharacterized protein n=1 Tax=Amycolatopsis decaplanina DSM 44594 TaxID=1284240 RepID=M2Y0S8_9PSEU|nr:hypothetical protein [Amycolatopsis decaplanina]EME55100.1 hypothetical protein H074_26367 [Amycolatopsis decaplanina DSM 44594]